jgi:AmmeMemoRadiSam system protein A
MITAQDAKILIGIARDSIANAEHSVAVTKKLREKQGVFVTLSKYSSGGLRGCVGIIEPILPLSEGVRKMAYAAAYEDTRFMPLSKDELDDVTVEISVLSKPEKTTIEKVKPGDGVIFKRGSFSGLFLPQVWEQLPDKDEFLDALCSKAGLLPGCWLKENVEVYKFSVVAFKEKKPNGEIVKVTH